MAESQYHITYLKNYRPSDYLIDSVDLTFDLDEKNTKVSSKLQMKANPAVEKRNPNLVLDGVDLKLLSVRVDQKTLSPSDYQQTSSQLTVLNVPDHFVLETECQIDPSSNTWLEGLYLSNGNFCTQC